MLINLWYNFIIKELGDVGMVVYKMTVMDINLNSTINKI